MRTLRSIAAVVMLVGLNAACHSPTSPGEGTSARNQGTPAQYGRLSGIVTIGPNCPGPQGASPCPTQPSAYATRKILVYSETKSNLLFTVDIDSQGAYVIDLAPAKYLIDLQPNGSDKTSDLPKTVDIQVNTVTQLNVGIDTGIR